MPKTPEEKAKHAEYQKKYRERKMAEIGEEEYKLQEKKKTQIRNFNIVKKIFEEENECIEKLNSMKIANDIVDNLKVKKGRGRPKKA